LVGDCIYIQVARGVRQMSSDGSKMLAGANGGRLYLGYPLDGTLRWTELTGGMQMLSGGMRG